VSSILPKISYFIPINRDEKFKDKITEILQNLIPSGVSCMDGKKICDWIEKTAPIIKAISVKTNFYTILILGKLSKKVDVQEILLEYIKKNYFLERMFL
jgi:hypothetical protein